MPMAVSLFLAMVVSVVLSATSSAITSHGRSSRPLSVEQAPAATPTPAPSAPSEPPAHDPLDMMGMLTAELQDQALILAFETERIRATQRPPARRRPPPR